MIGRRGFLGSILALGAAPAIVRASSIMPILLPPGAGEIWHRLGTITSSAAREVDDACLFDSPAPGVVNFPFPICMASGDSLIVTSRATFGHNGEVTFVATRARVVKGMEDLLKSP